MFSDLKAINSKDKRNIRFVAAGSYQIEFFEIENNEFFAIYRFNYGSEGGSQYALINLKHSSVACVSDNEYQIIKGINTYKVVIKQKGESLLIHVIRYAWGWLPLSRFGGKASSAGVSSLKANLKVYADDLAA